MYSVDGSKKYPRLLWLMVLLACQLAGCERRTPYTLETPWTVELQNAGIKVVLRAPFGTFKIWHKADIDYVDLKVKGLRSMEMDWHFESGMPFGVWSNLPENKDKNDITVYSNIAPIAQGESYAARRKDVHFEERKESPDPPQEIGLVWNSTAIKYENSHNTWYVIEDRSELDGLLITCSNSAFYCDLRGARVAERLGIESLTIPMEDVENWRLYQVFVQEKVRAAIVSIEPIESE